MWPLILAAASTPAWATEASHCDADHDFYSPLEGGTPIERVEGMPPQFPFDMMMRGQDGLVRVRFDVMPDGRIRNIDTVEAHPPRGFGSAVREAMRNWRYRPHTLNGEATICEGVEFRFEFHIDNPQ